MASAALRRRVRDAGPRGRVLAVLAALCVLVIAELLPQLAHAQGRQDIIGAIRVTGNQRIEDETVISYMKVAVGDPFTGPRIDESLKSLFATGLFADVAMRRDGAIPPSPAI